mgnify:CR=1 FL=1
MIKCCALGNITLNIPSIAFHSLYPILSNNIAIRDISSSLLPTSVIRSTSKPDVECSERIFFLSNECRCAFLGVLQLQWIHNEYSIFSLYGVDIIRVKKWFQTDLESYNKISEIIKNVEIIEDNIGIAIYDKDDKKLKPYKMFKGGR